MKFSLNEIKEATGADISFSHSEAEGSEILRYAQNDGIAEESHNLKNFEISTDTRTIKKGDLYLPLKGASFDGEDFCQKAIENGAAGCFYTKEKPCEVAIKVKDTLTTYLQLANFARKKINPIVIGVTGSSGKTTTKEMIYSVMSEKFRTHKTFSNHNNEIGFCQTVLSMKEDCEVLIVEMGMRG